MGDAAGPLQIGGYVVAGGRSTRMGRDKALLELGGRPLIEIAVGKLQQVCAEVKILAGDARGELGTALGAYGRVVFDRHTGCGPIGGIEAALAETRFDWNLIVPVDMPLLPAEFLEEWAREVLGRHGARVGLFEVGGRRRAMPLMVRREVGVFLARAIERGEYALLAALEGAAVELGGEVFVRSAEGREEWFANVNTPEEWAAASPRLKPWVT
jgi:molybdopterin-guanine dinucleotide biosynthesis protein A